MDREKVIKGLECAIGIRGIKNCDDCPYDNDYNCLGCDIVMRDALALLKEQEAKNVDTFMQWCIDSHIMGDATVRGIKYWLEKFKEGR